MTRVTPAPRTVALEAIETEIASATGDEIRAYLHGASRNGTFNRLHKTLRIAQADTEWLGILSHLLGRLGKRSWIYQEGCRNVWVIETTWRAESPEPVHNRSEPAAFVRGYFDAEGGVPANVSDRFYVQFVQKNRTDLTRTHELLELLGVRCGRLHNPSVRQDPDYWRFYVLAASHRQFVNAIGSWHPRKRVLLDKRVVSSDVVRLGG